MQEYQKAKHMYVMGDGISSSVHEGIHGLSQTTFEVKHLTHHTALQTSDMIELIKVRIPPPRTPSKGRMNQSSKQTIYLNINLVFCLPK